MRAAAVGSRAVEIFRAWRPDVVLLDLVLPDIDGIALLRQLKAIDDAPEMIVISGVGTITRALEAGQAGAFYFIEKSNLDPAGIVSILDRATDLQVERAQHERLKEQVRDQYAFSNIIGKSKNMRELFELIEAVAESDANILIQGENGVGKELIANAIHVRSGRAQGPVHQDQLRGAAEGADRVGALRLQERRVHRRDHRQGRPAGAGRRRIADARRDRRDAAAAADQAAARAAGARVPADWQRSPRQGGLPADLRDQRRSRRGDARTAGCARTCISASTR